MTDSATPAQGTRTITITVDPDTFARLEELAGLQEENSVNQESATVAQLLEHAAWCMADVLRRPGSWEAAAARQLLQGEGYATEPQEPQP